ncbi:hypothetical protein G9A89_009233 [Geosiphon pyriformis]|nr:hypothetical protein G9A89_009233 [Geosiphon pyriformis]
MSQIPEKNKQGLQNPKPISTASAIPNNLTMPRKNTIEKLETRTEIELLHEISPFFFMKAQCLVQTSQILSQKDTQNPRTKSTIFKAATIESIKTDNDS